MEEQILFTNSQGLRLAVILSRPMRRHKLPIVVTCHGFGSGKDSETNRRLVQRLNQLGIASLRFDFSGHNDSEGDIARVTVSQGVDDLRSAVTVQPPCGAEIKDGGGLPRSAASMTPRLYRVGVRLASPRPRPQGGGLNAYEKA